MFDIIQFGPFDWLVLERKGNTALLLMKQAIDIENEINKDNQYHRRALIDDTLLP